MRLFIALFLFYELLQVVSFNFAILWLLLGDIGQAAWNAFQIKFANHQASQTVILSLQVFDLGTLTGSWKREAGPGQYGSRLLLYGMHTILQTYILEFPVLESMELSSFNTRNSFLIQNFNQERRTLRSHLHPDWWMSWLQNAVSYDGHLDVENSTQAVSFWDYTIDLVRITCLRVNQLNPDEFILITRNPENSMNWVWLFDSEQRRMTQTKNTPILKQAEKDQP